MAWRVCPYCKERVKRDAVVCRYCHRDLEPLPAEGDSRSVSVLMAFMAMGAGAALVLLWGYYKEWKSWHNDVTDTDI